MYASELVTQISNLNKGIYLDEDLKNSAEVKLISIMLRGRSPKAKKKVVKKTISAIQN